MWWCPFFPSYVLALKFSSCLPSHTVFSVWEMKLKLLDTICYNPFHFCATQNNVQKAEPCTEHRTCRTQNNVQNAEQHAERTQNNVENSEQTTQEWHIMEIQRWELRFKMRHSCFWFFKFSEAMRDKLCRTAFCHLVQVVLEV